MPWMIYFQQSAVVARRLRTSTAMSLGKPTHHGSPLMWDDVGMLVDVVEVDVQTWSVLSDEHS